MMNILFRKKSRVIEFYFKRNHLNPIYTYGKHTGARGAGGAIWHGSGDREAEGARGAIWHISEESEKPKESKEPEEPSGMFRESEESREQEEPSAPTQVAESQVAECWKTVKATKLPKVGVRLVENEIASGI